MNSVYEENKLIFDVCPSGVSAAAARGEGGGGGGGEGGLNRAQGAWAPGDPTEGKDIPIKSVFLDEI